MKALLKKIKQPSQAPKHGLNPVYMNIKIQNPVFYFFLVRSLYSGILQLKAIFPVPFSLEQAIPVDMKSHHLEALNPYISWFCIH